MSEQVIATKKTKKNTLGKTLISLRNITKKFSDQDRYVVDNINLDINQGDLFVLVGPSGCGKTTLLRMLAGFEKPTTGTILLDGQDITSLPPYQRPLNTVFQSYALFPHMTVRENIEFGLRQENLSKTQINSRTSDVLDIVKLHPFVDRKPSQLSGGQMQRVALARSLVKRPKVLLLDEPLGALDRKIREETQLELIKLQHMLDITFIMVTHDQEEAMAMADKMAVMNSGKVLQVGTPEEIYESPNSKFVAEFVDSINLFKGRIVTPVNADGYIGISMEETEDIIMARPKEDLSENQKIWLGLRPEEVDISITPPPKYENCVEGRIIDYGFLGQKIVYHVELKNKRAIHVSIPTSERTKNPHFVPGKKVYVSWYHSDGVVLSK